MKIFYSIRNLFRSDKIIKIDDTHFEHHYSNKTIEKWNNKRRDEDNVLELINKEGMHFKPRGRSGYLYFTYKSRIAEIYTELGFKGIIIQYRNTDTWQLPKNQKMTQEERDITLLEIKKWREKTGNTLDIEY